MLVDSTFWDRAFFLLIGMCMGAIMGWTSYAWREAREALREAHEVHKEMIRLDERLSHHDHKRKRNEDGLLRTRVWGNVALIVVVGITLYSAFQAQVAINRTDDLIEANTQNVVTVQRTQYCTEAFVKTTLAALNARTDLNSQSLEANRRLQKAQSKLLTSRGDTEEERLQAFARYIHSLEKYIDVTDELSRKVVQYPYPESADYTACLTRTREEELPK